jgi:hypothetical protein
MTVKTFDGVDEMVAAVAQSEAAVAALTTDAQRAITYGEFWCAPADQSSYLRFGVIARGTSPSAPVSRTSAARAAKRKDEHRRGYRFGCAYSAIEPEGQWGSTHVSTMVAKLSRAQFEQIRATGWRLETLVDDEIGWAVRLVDRAWTDAGKPLAP